MKDVVMLNKRGMVFDALIVGLCCKNLSSPLCAIAILGNFNPNGISVATQEVVRCGLTQCLEVL